MDPFINKTWVKRRNGNNGQGCADPNLLPHPENPEHPSGCRAQPWDPSRGKELSRTLQPPAPLGKSKTPNSSPTLTPATEKGDEVEAVQSSARNPFPCCSHPSQDGFLDISPVSLRSTLKESPFPNVHKKPELQRSSPKLPLLHLHGALLPNPASSTLQTPRALGSQGQERVLLERQN